MNCKPPCLAIVKRGYLGFKHTGKIVEVLLEPWPNLEGGAGWTIVFPHPIRLLDGSMNCRAFAPDAWLLPIEGNPGEDETLQWAPVPGDKVAA